VSLDDELDEVIVEGQKTWVRPKDVPRIAGIRAEPAVRLLPNFDAYVMGFRPREQLHDKRFADRIFRKGAWISPVVLVDGRAAGVWGYQRGKRGVEVTIEPFERLSAARRKTIREEADRLGAFLDSRVRLSMKRPS
jgi:hypothetical protein